MRTKTKPEAPKDKRTRTLKNRAPDPHTDSVGFEDVKSNATPQDTRYLRSPADPFGHVRVTVGFELVSCATPPRAHRAANYGGAASFFAGEPELANDMHTGRRIGQCGNEAIPSRWPAGGVNFGSWICPTLRPTDADATAGSACAVSPSKQRPADAAVRVSDRAARPSAARRIGCADVVVGRGKRVMQRICGRRHTL